MVSWSASLQNKIPACQVSLGIVNDNCDTQFSEFRNGMPCVAAVERKACKSEVTHISHQHPSKQIHVPLIYNKLLDFLSVV